MMIDRDTAEFAALWNEWLKTDDGRVYEACKGKYENFWHAIGRVWCLERMLERRTRERDEARAAGGDPGPVLPDPR